MAKEPVKRKKKAAPKKARPPAKAKAKRKAKAKSTRKAKAKTHGTSALSSVEPPRGRELIRWQMGQSYIFDVEQRSMEWWQKNHYTQIPFETVRKWAAADKWTDRRERHWEAVQAAVARKYAREHTGAMLEELKELDEMVDVASSLTIGKTKDGRMVPLAEVKSYEGAVGAFVKLSQHRDDKREKTLDNLPLALGSQSSDLDDIGPGVEFSPEQLRAMSEAALRVEFGLPEGEAEDDNEGG